MKRLKDTDVAEKTMRLRLGMLIGMSFFLVLIIIDAILFDVAHLSLVPILLILLLDLVVLWLLFQIVWGIINGSSRMTVARLWAGGGPPGPRGYSEQEALVARGEIDKAVASYRDRIAANPADLNARLRLGALLAGQGDHVEAEHWFLQVRTVGASAQQELVLGNSLIDLYRASGDRSKLKAELARFARNNAASEAGLRAQQHLRVLTREDADGDEAAQR